MLISNSQKTLQFIATSKIITDESKIIVIAIERALLEKFQFLDNISAVESGQMEVTEYKLDEKTIIIENKAYQQNKDAG